MKTLAGRSRCAHCGSVFVSHSPNHLQRCPSSTGWRRTSFEPVAEKETVYAVPVDKHRPYRIGHAPPLPPPIRRLASVKPMLRRAP